jgi:hypothetical protein
MHYKIKPRNLTVVVNGMIANNMKWHGLNLFHGSDYTGLKRKGHVGD